MARELAKRMRDADAKKDSASTLDKHITAARRMSAIAFANAKLENTLQKAVFDVVEAEKARESKLLFRFVVVFLAQKKDRSSESASRLGG